MDNNIFENAKFGDKFLTREGRVVIFYYKDKHNAYAKFVTFINNEPQDLITLLPNGNYCLYENPNDIVSRYKEPIDEEKKVIINKACQWLHKNMCYLEASKEDKKNLNMLIDILQTND